MTAPSAIRTAIIDDHEAIRLGVGAALQQHTGGQVRVVSSHETVDAFLADHVEADVVMLDLSLGDDTDPKDNVERLAEVGYRILVYSIADNMYLVRRALAGGADGVCRKAEPIAQTIEALEAVAHGQMVLSQEILGAIESDTSYVAASLGPRERQVLSLYVAGLEIPEVAQQLYITDNSVKEYLKRIRVKYTQVNRPANNKLDLLRRAIEDGIIPPVERRT
ncbi:MAG: response regulator transcription factor [Micropruina sp.]|nr:response regulator transcription factor [Micropruina sp.]